MLADFPFLGDKDTLLSKNQKKGETEGGRDK